MKRKPKFWSLINQAATLADALSAAIHSATGVWIDQLPATQEVIPRAFGKLH
jgi:hypothetical protein